MGLSSSTAGWSNFFTEKRSSIRDKSHFFPGKSCPITGKNVSRPDKSRSEAGKSVADWDNGTTLSGGDAAKSSGGTKTWLDAGSKGHNGTILPAWPDFTLHPLAKGLQKLPPEKSTHGRCAGNYKGQSILFLWFYIMPKQIVEPDSFKDQQTCKRDAYLN
jgi:hypothetical protein